MPLIFGYDVSEHQAGFDHAKAYQAGYRFVIARCSQGTYRDKAFKDHMRAIKKTQLVFGAYMRVGDTSAPDVQARVVHEQVGDTRVPIFIDSEDKPVDEAKHYRVAQELRKLGYRVAASYLPSWYWEQIGKPKLRIGPLWSSRYVSGTGTGPQLYEKVTGDFWKGYGGQKVKLLQFTDRAKIAGHAVDASAFKGTMAGLRNLFYGTRSAKKVAKKAEIVTTLAGTPLDLSSLPSGSGPRFKFRDRLTNTSGAYPGCVCECIPRWVALVEALAKEHKLPVPLQFWEGSFVVTANSGRTHAGGGALDIKITGLTAAQVTALVRICRMAGGAAWLRDWAHGRFDTPHIHVELIGCSHAHADARAQWKDYKAGRDGLATHGPDYGPRVAYIKAAKAFKKLTRTGVTPADSKDWLEMATKKEVQDAMVAALKQVLTGDIYPSPSLDPESVKKNPKWYLTSLLNWQVKLTSFIRRDMPTKKQLDARFDELIKAIKESK
jgi:hypothetical protein